MPHPTPSDKDIRIMDFSNPDETSSDETQEEPTGPSHIPPCAKPRRGSTPKQADIDQHDLTTAAVTMVTVDSPAILGESPVPSYCGIAESASLTQGNDASLTLAQTPKCPNQQHTSSCANQSGSTRKSDLDLTRVSTPTHPERPHTSSCAKSESGSSPENESRVTSDATSSLDPGRRLHESHSSEKSEPGSSSTVIEQGPPFPAKTAAGQNPDRSVLDNRNMDYDPLEETVLKQQNHGRLTTTKDRLIQLIESRSDQLVELLQERHALREQVSVRRVAIEQLVRIRSEGGHINNRTGLLSPRGLSV